MPSNHDTQCIYQSQTLDLLSDRTIPEALCSSLLFVLLSLLLSLLHPVTKGYNAEKQKKVNS